MEWLDQIFGRTGIIEWHQECARAVLIFFYGLLLVRVSGRRAFGKWAALDIIVSIVVGSNLSRALTGNGPLWGTLAATTLLMTLHWALAQASARWVPLSRLFEGSPVPLGRDGRTWPHVLHRHGVSRTDIDEALRQSGLQDFDDVQLATLEPSGKITVIKRSDD